MVSDPDDVLYGILKGFCLRNERCPTTADIRGMMSATGAANRCRASVMSLARAGRVVCEIHSHNYRVVRLVDTELATKAAPDRYGQPSQPYRIIDKDGDRRIQPKYEGSAVPVDRKRKPPGGWL